MSAERWIDIPGYENLYQASTEGNIKALEKRRVQPRFGGIRVYPEKIMKLYTTPKGYLGVKLCNDSKHKTHRVNRLIAISWLDNPENKGTVNHKDGVKTNNRISNLEWSTQSENNKHARDNDLNNNFGQTHHTAKLSNEDIRHIRSIIKVKNQTEIAKEYNISSAQVSNIVNNKQWKHI